MREESLIKTLQDISDIKCAVESIAYADNKIDWEQRRYEIAKSAMNAMLANPELLQVVTSKEYVVELFAKIELLKCRLIMPMPS